MLLRKHNTIFRLSKELNVRLLFKVFQYLCSVVEGMLACFSLSDSTLSSVFVSTSILSGWLFVEVIIFCCWVVLFIPQTSCNDCYCFQDFVFVVNSFLALKLSLAPCVWWEWKFTCVFAFDCLWRCLRFCCNCQCVLSVFSNWIRTISFLLFRG